MVTVECELSTFNVNSKARVCTMKRTTCHNSRQVKGFGN